MEPFDYLVRRIAEQRLGRDLRIAREHDCPPLLRLEAYLPQARRDAEVVTRFSKKPFEIDF